MLGSFSSTASRNTATVDPVPDPTPLDADLDSMASCFLCRPITSALADAESDSDVPMYYSAAGLLAPPAAIAAPSPLGRELVRYAHPFVSIS